MAPQPPLILVDSVYDRINLYPNALLTSSTPVVGREVQYVADYRRERTYFQASAAAANNEVRTDLGAGNTAVVDSVWIDRGHNLWNATVFVEGSGDNFGTSPDSLSSVVPASGTVGGDPTTGWAVTEEGALYRLFTAFTTRRYFRIRVSTVLQALIPGVILGKRYQLETYSSVRDEDAGERSSRSEKSNVPGYEGRDRTYARRKLTLQLSKIGATEYDATIRQLRRLLFETDQPGFVVMNYGTHPERGWLYQYEGANWSSPMQRVLRDNTLTMAEVGPLVR